MKKLTFFLPFLCLSLMFSCKKSEMDPTPANVVQNLNVAKIALSSTAVNQDTVPPSNAVNVKTYGAYGDGVHDDTQAIQNAINAQSNVVFGKGTYIINQALSMRSGVRVYGTNGATVKAGGNLSGRLLNQGMYFYVNAVSKCGIINLIFKPSSTKAFTLGSWGNSCICLLNSQATDIKYNTFSFTQAYKSTGLEGIWISGTGSINNYVGHNTLNTVGLEYAEAGASNNIVIANTITNAHADGMSAHGNTSSFCTGNQVINNTIINAGHMGIEDWGNCNASIIKGNVITGTGKDPAQASDGIGISAVGVNTTVSLNNITDAQFEYIEVGGNSKIIESNKLNDVRGVAEGVVINLYGQANPKATIFTTLVNHNTITGCYKSIVVEGPYNPSVNITNNVIYNPKYVGVNIMSNSSSFNVSVANNYIQFSVPNVASRVGINCYSTPLASGQKVSMAGNTVQYNSGSGGGPGKEYALLPQINNVVISSNKISGNNITTAKGAVIGLTANATKYTGYQISNNTFTGVFIDITGFINSVISTNVF